MPSKREILWMPEQRIAIYKLEELQKQKEYFNNLIALLLNNNFVSREKITSLREKWKTDREILKKIEEESKKAWLYKEFLEITQRRVEKVLMTWEEYYELFKEEWNLWGGWFIGEYCNR